MRNFTDGLNFAKYQCGDHRFFCSVLSAPVLFCMRN